MGRNMKVMIEAWRCENENCRHVWLSDGGAPPRRCSKCKSRRWHRTGTNGAEIRKLRQISAETVAKQIATLRRRTALRRAIAEEKALVSLRR
jgi:hypothetical protein